MRKLSFYLLVFLLKGWTPPTASTNELRDNGCQQIKFDQDSFVCACTRLALAISHKTNAFHS